MDLGCGYGTLTQDIQKVNHVCKNAAKEPGDSLPEGTMISPVLKAMAGHWERSTGLLLLEISLNPRDMPLHQNEG